MELNEAKKLLNLCEREELRDHAFGDREVFWSFMGEEVAGGYLGPTNKGVWLLDYDEVVALGPAAAVIASFEDKDATELSSCGKIKRIERNDMQGEDIPTYRGA